jgi:hypothetical protein
MGFYCIVILGSSEALQKVAHFFVDGTTFLKLSTAVILYPVLTSPEVNHYPLSRNQRVLAIL